MLDDQAPIKDLMVMRSTRLLDAPGERLVNRSIFGDFVEVPMSSNEQVEGEGELREGTLGHAFHGRLVVHLQPPVSTRPREPYDVPLVNGQRFLTPAIIHIA